MDNPRTFSSSDSTSGDPNSHKGRVQRHGAQVVLKALVGSHHDELAVIKVHVPALLVERPGTDLGLHLNLRAYLQQPDSSQQTQSSATASGEGSQKKCKKRPQPPVRTRTLHSGPAGAPLRPGGRSELGTRGLQRSTSRHPSAEEGLGAGTSVSDTAGAAVAVCPRFPTLFSQLGAPPLGRQAERGSAGSAGPVYEGRSEPDAVCCFRPRGRPASSRPSPALGSGRQHADERGHAALACSLLAAGYTRKATSAACTPCALRRPGSDAFVCPPESQAVQGDEAALLMLALEFWDAALYAIRSSTGDVYKRHAHGSAREEN